ncbi:MAG: cupin domain-containing protein [Planctomycetota bacterium]
MIGNLFTDIAEASAEEAFTTLVRGRQFRLERIVSHGHVTPPDQWYDQDEHEWVMVLAGAARLRFADGAGMCELRPGDHLVIAAHRRHRVEWTDPERATVWLAVHYR